MADPGQEIVIYQNRAIIAYEPESDAILSLDQAIDAWVDESYKRSGSEKTKAAYKDTLENFRAYLQASGRDLDSDYKQIARAARSWVDERSEHSNRAGKPISKSTYYQRLAILSSFYRVAVREDVVPRNPIETIKRDRQGKKEPARWLSEEEVRAGLAKIDRSTLTGKRDYVLLLVALNTGHRASELAGIRLQHLTFTSNGTCSIEWDRCKGNKDMEASILPAKATAPLITYLQAVYGHDFKHLSEDTAIWVSFSRQNKNEAIGTRTISNICEAYLGTTKVHVTRHTAAKKMMDKGATLAQIGAFLGHSNLKTTSDYVEELEGYHNPFADVLADAFSLEEE